MRKPGCIPPVFYFVNCNDSSRPLGYIIMAPYSDCPAPPGYAREYVETLSGARDLEKRINLQDMREHQQEYERDFSLIKKHQQEVRDRMYARMTSGDCSQFEKDFIRGWMELKDEQKKKKYEQRYLEHTGYLWALHNDVGKRKEDKEEVSLDRINF